MTTGVLNKTETGRVCGHCQLCCTVLPVYDLFDAMGRPKLWNQKCRHQRKGNHGCTVYNTVRPASCRSWSCAWLSVSEAENLKRPDKGHYIVDTYLTEFELTKLGKYTALQVWLEPGWPLAWRCQQLMRFLHRMGEEHGYATVVRFSEVKEEMLIVFPPGVEPVKEKWSVVDVREGTVDIEIQVFSLKDRK